MLGLIRSLIVIIVVAIGLAFGYFNLATTPIDLLFAQVKAPLIVALAIAFVLGAVLGLLASGVRILSLREQLARSQRELKNSRTEAAARSQESAPKT